MEFVASAKKFSQLFVEKSHEVGMAQFLQKNLQFFGTLYSLAQALAFLKTFLRGFLRSYR